MSVAGPWFLSELAAGCVGVLLLLSPLAILIARRRHGSGLIYGACALASCALALVALLARLSPAPPGAIELAVGLPLGRTILGYDPLGAAFALIINVATTLVSGYAIGYGAHAREPQRVVPFYPAFIAGMNLVLLSRDAFSFLVGWEFMSLASWALVASDHASAENRRAALVYLIMATGGALTLLFAFGLLAGPSGGYGFAEMRHAAHVAAAPLVLVPALIGAGSKAGLVPLHARLPLAHPAAPSHVSALMSGVMTKVAVYGFIRIVFDLAGPPSWWWSLPVLVVAGITTLLGVLYALMEHDLKRLLAYHTIENIGIIFIGLGLALAFQANDMAAAAALSLTAALFHVFNHSVFKSLLFFGAGAVLVATGERDMEHLGGLIHRMPQTAFAFLVGCVAISALPPFNGFVSEWLTFQAILQSPQLPSWGLKLMVPAVGALLALSAALAAACFVRAFGFVFLGRARSPGAAGAHETDSFSLAAMIALALACLVAGILPGFFIDALAPVVQSLVNGRMPVQAGVEWLSIVPIAEGRSSYNGLLVFLFMVASGAIAAFAIHRLASDRLRRGPAWGCGYPDTSTNTQYTVDSFAQPIRRVFGTVVFRAREIGEMPPPGSTAPARLTVELRDLIWDTLYAPIAIGVAFAAERLNYL